jgi:hypothetical protein
VQHTRIGRQLIAALIISSTIALTAQAVDVYSVKFSFSGANQDQKGGLPAINSVKGTGNNLINLARGRDVNASVPANEVLAALMNCSAALSLVVYDTSAHTVLATIATPTESGTVGSPKQGLGVVAAQVATAGNSSNGLTGGFLVFTGKVTLDGNGCPVKGSIAATGLLDVTITDDMGTNPTEVLVMKGKLSIGSKIGTITP